MNPLLIEIQKKIDSNIISTFFPPQGMGSNVFFITTQEGNKYAVKESGKENNDSTVLKIISNADIVIKVPKLINSFEFEGKSIVILEKIDFPLLESINTLEMGKYIPSMIKNLNNLHTIKSDKAGYINSKKRYMFWKDFLLSFFNGKNPSLNWNEIKSREGLDEKLIHKSIEKIIEVIKKTEFFSTDYSLLHSDFNQRNLFVNPDTNDLAAIIDWGEAMYGDPVYDFARIRMYIWHFDLGDTVIKNYYNLMNYSVHKKKLDTLYWLVRVIEYLAYYSEELNEFNCGRIKLHQDFLRNFDWAVFE